MRYWQNYKKKNKRVLRKNNFYNRNNFNFTKKWKLGLSLTFILNVLIGVKLRHFRKNHKFVHFVDDFPTKKILIKYAKILIAYNNWTILAKTFREEMTFWFVSFVKRNLKINKRFNYTQKNACSKNKKLTFYSKKTKIYKIGFQISKVKDKMQFFCSAKYAKLWQKTMSDIIFIII